MSGTTRKTSVSRRGRHTSAWKNVVLSQEQQFSLKRAALLREAGRAFSIRGYHNTSLDEVARTLDVTKAALYYYVKNKQEILFECHMMSLDLGEEALKFCEQNGKNGLDKVLLLIGKYVELITSEMGSFVVLGEFDALEPENKATIARRRDKFDPVLPPTDFTRDRRRIGAFGRSQDDSLLLHGCDQLDDPLVQAGWPAGWRTNRRPPGRPDQGINPGTLNGRPV